MYVIGAFVLGVAVVGILLNVLMMHFIAGELKLERTLGKAVKTVLISVGLTLPCNVAILYFFREAGAFLAPGVYLVLAMVITKWMYRCSMVHAVLLNGWPLFSAGSSLLWYFFH